MHARWKNTKSFRSLITTRALVTRGARAMLAVTARTARPMGAHQWRRALVVLVALEALAIPLAPVGALVNVGFPLPSSVNISQFQVATLDSVDFWAHGYGTVDVRGLAEVNVAAQRSRVTNATKTVLTEIGNSNGDGYGFDGVSARAYGQIPTRIIEEVYERDYVEWRLVSWKILKTSSVTFDVAWSGVGPWKMTPQAFVGICYIPCVEAGAEFSRDATATGSLRFHGLGVNVDLPSGHTGSMRFWR